MEKTLIRESTDIHQFQTATVPFSIGSAGLCSSAQQQGPPGRESAWTGGANAGKEAQGQPPLKAVEDGKPNAVPPVQSTSASPTARLMYTRRTRVCASRLQGAAEVLVQKVRDADSLSYYEKMPNEALADLKTLRTAYNKRVPEDKHISIGLIDTWVKTGNIHTAAEMKLLPMRVLRNARAFAEWGLTEEGRRVLGAPETLKEYVQAFAEKIEEASQEFDEELHAMASTPPCTKGGQCQVCHRIRDAQVMTSSRFFCHGDGCDIPQQLLAPEQTSHSLLTPHHFSRFCDRCFTRHPPVSPEAYTTDTTPPTESLAPSRVFKCINRGCDAEVHWLCSGADLFSADAALEDNKSPRVLCYACGDKPAEQIHRLEEEEDGREVVHISGKLRQPTEVEHTQASALIEMTIRGGLRDGRVAQSDCDSINVREMSTEGFKAHGFEQQSDDAPAWTGTRRHFAIFQTKDGIPVILGSLEMQEMEKVDDPRIKHAVLALLDTVRTDDPSTIRRPAAALAVLALSHFARLTGALTFKWHAQCPEGSAHQFILHDKGVPVGVHMKRANGSQQVLLLDFYCGVVQLRQDRGLQGFVRGTADWVHGAACVGKMHRSEPLVDSAIMLPKTEGIADYPPFPNFIVTKVLQKHLAPPALPASKRLKNSEAAPVAAMPNPGVAIHKARVDLNSILDGKSKGKVFVIDFDAINKRMAEGGPPMGQTEDHPAVLQMNAIAINNSLPARCTLKHANQTVFEPGKLLMMVEVNQGGFSSPALAYYTTQLLLSAALREDGRRYLTRLYHQSPAPAH